MERVKEIAKQLNVLPKLRLGIRQQKGGVKATGPHTVKFLKEPMVVMGKDNSGKPRKEMKFEVEEKGQRYRWMVPIIGRDGQPSYLVERLMEVGVGEERVLEMLKQGAINYIDIRLPGEDPNQPEGDEGELTEEEIESELEKEAQKEPGA